MAEDLIAAQQPAFLGEWQFNNTATAPPSTIQIRLNNATQTAATLMWVHKITANGIDSTTFLTGIKKGQEISLQNKSDPTGKWQVYAVTGDLIDNSTYMEYPIAWLRGGATLPEQRVMLDALGIRVSVTGNAMTASIGTPTIVIGSPSVSANVNVTGLSMIAAIGNPAIVITTPGVSATVTVTGLSMIAAIGIPEVTGQMLEPVLLPGQAFPSNTPAGFSPGMTLRQWYASQAMSGFIASAPAANLIGGNLAAFCFKVADSMVKHEEREARGARQLTVSVNAPPKANPPTQSAPDSVSMKDALALQKREAAQTTNGKGKRQGRLTTL